jgi:RNA polymerase sigma-70 factor (ECF subfamily)
MDRTETTALLLDAKGGSDEALNRLLERCAGKLLALIRLRMDRALRARMESRDILNATLMKAFQHLDQFEKADSSSLMGWLARIAENELRDQRDYHGRQRRDAAQVVALDQGLDGLEARVRSQTSRLFFKEELSRLERALQTLDEQHREVILLRKLEELSFVEIGERMGKSTDACRMLLARAMAALTLQMQGSS